MNVKEIKEMIALMNENNLTELELEKEGLRIRLKKGQGGYIEQMVMPSAPMQHVAMPAAGQMQKEERQEAPSNMVQIKAPMVGTFYKSPAPDAPPYVEIGAAVEVGQVICIIEAMKLMNEIKSEIKGKVSKILVENGTPIEFGQPLFLIEPA